MTNRAQSRIDGQDPKPSNPMVGLLKQLAGGAAVRMSKFAAKEVQRACGGGAGVKYLKGGAAEVTLI